MVERNDWFGRKPVLVDVPSFGAPSLGEVSSPDSHRLRLSPICGAVSCKDAGFHRLRPYGYDAATKPLCLNNGSV